MFMYMYMYEHTTKNYSIACKPAGCFLPHHLPFILPRCCSPSWS